MSRREKRRKEPHFYLRHSLPHAILIWLSARIRVSISTSQASASIPSRACWFHFTRGPPTPATLLAQKIFSRSRTVAACLGNRLLVLDINFIINLDEPQISPRVSIRGQIFARPWRRRKPSDCSGRRFRARSQESSLLVGSVCSAPEQCHDNAAEAQRQAPDQLE